MNFFSLDSASNYELYTMEKILPILFLIFIIILLIAFKNKFINNLKLDMFIRYGLAIISFSFLTLYYILKWYNYGFNCNTVPLHICFISNILCIVLCFNKSKKLSNFLFFTGILGGISSLLLPDLSLSYEYFRYYQFYVCHISIIFIPLYFYVVYNYKPKFIDCIKSFGILQIIGIPIGIFNEIYKTNYMFISFTSNFAAKDNILENLGNGPYYIFYLELLAFLILILWYFITYMISNLTVKKFKIQKTN
ncbi:MAG: TIGR02206 family membrane protein [Clostridium paraputrificum]